MLDEVEREFLKIIIESEKKNYKCSGVYNNFPIYIVEQQERLFSKLKNAGYIASFEIWLTGWRCVITPLGKNYFEKEEKYQNMNNNSNVSIGILNVTGSSINFGNIYNSRFNVNNLYNEIEQMINEKGFDDKEELMKVLAEVKSYVNNILATKEISENKRLFNKIGKHVEKHQWFYQLITTLVGNIVLNIMKG